MSADQHLSNSEPTEDRREQISYCLLPIELLFATIVIAIRTTVVVTVRATIGTTIGAELRAELRVMTWTAFGDKPIGAHRATLHRLTVAVALAIRLVVMLAATPLRWLRVPIAYAAIWFTVHRVTTILVETNIDLYLHRGVSLLRSSLLCLSLAQRHHR